MSDTNTSFILAGSCLISIIIVLWVIRLFAKQTKSHFMTIEHPSRRVDDPEKEVELIEDDEPVEDWEEEE
jgi:hypothetical protein